MKDTLSTHQAADRLADVYGGSSFSYAGALALVEWYEELEESTGEEIEFDPIAFACEWSEYRDLQGWAEDYGIDWRELVWDPEEADDDDKDRGIREYIEDRGSLIEFDGGILVSSF